MVNLVCGGLESVLECPAAEADDLATRHPVVLAVIEAIRMFSGRENNMAGRKEDPIAPVETASAFEVREGPRSNLEGDRVRE